MSQEGHKSKRMVNLRVGTFLDPPLVDKNEKGEPSGMKLYVRSVNLVKYMAAQRGFNLTSVYSKGLNFGKYVNGTYDGILGLIYNDEADVLVVPCPVDTFPQPGEFGSTVISADIHIYTIVDPSSWQLVDFLSCLNVFNTTINSLIMLALISIGFLLVKHYKSKAFLVLFANALAQSFSAVEALGFLPHLSMLMGILFVHALHGALYSTSAWIESGPKKVDTLHDMLIQGKEPVIYKGGAEYHMFKNGFSKDAKKVWKRAEKLGLSKCVLDNDQWTQMAMTGKFTSKQAFLYLSYFEAIATVMCCQFQAKRFDDGFRFYASKPVHSQLAAALRNPRLSFSVAKHVDNVFYNFFEFGYVENLKQDFKNNPPMDSGLAPPKCRREAFKARARNEGESDIKLTLSDLGQTLTLFFAILIVLSALFFIEFLRRH